MAFKFENKYLLLSSLPDTAHARAPGNDAPAPGIDGGTAKGGGRGIENAPEDSESRRDGPTKILPLKPNSDDSYFVFCFFVNCWKCSFFYSLFFKTSLCRFLNKKQICNCICTAFLQDSILF